MIREVYCSCEVAKLLKDKGFDQNCATYYLDGQVWRHHYVEAIPKGKQIYAAPTQAMAMKWLREMYNIHIGINPISGKGYNATIYDVADFDDYGIIFDTEFFFHPEEAIEAALKYCLENLI